MASRYPTLGPVARVALNLRGVSRDVIHRGDALVTPDAWPSTRALDVRRDHRRSFDRSPRATVVHVGTAAVPARLRPFDEDHGRLTLDRRLPLVLGDRLVLRDPGGSGCSAGRRCSTPNRRRCGGAATARAGPRAESGWTPRGDVATEVARRGAVPEHHLRRLGLLCRE